jgi:hypothetical protein
LQVLLHKDFSEEATMSDSSFRIIPILIVAFVFALAGAPNVAVADHCKGKHKNDPSCDSGGGGGGSGIIFSVSFVGDPLAPGSNLFLPSCTAQTPASSGNSFATTAIFPRHDLCATLTTSDDATLTDDIIIQTVTTRSGDIIGVQVTGQDIIGEDGIAHESDVLDVDPIVQPDGAGFTLHVHATDVDLWKLDTHLRKKKSKRVEHVGTFSLGDMIYTPDP